MADLFYADALGLASDPAMHGHPRVTWYNIGRQQVLHLCAVHCCTGASAIAVMAMGCCYAYAVCISICVIVIRRISDFMPAKHAFLPVKCQEAVHDAAVKALVPCHQYSISTVKQRPKQDSVRGCRHNAPLVSLRVANNMAA